MKSSFLIAWRSLWRGRCMWTLLAAVAAFHFLLPRVVRSDGTDAGAFEMNVKVVCGAVFALVCTASLFIGGGMFAKEREAELLPQSIVRPAAAFSMAVGRWLAVLMLFACVLFANAVMFGAMRRGDGSMPPDCRMHVSPSLPAAEVSAAQAMDAFLKDERTPAAVKKSSRTAILALLAAKENERYEVVRPGRTARWPFPDMERRSLAVKARFSTMYGMKASFSGIFTYGDRTGAVSNCTQAVLETPLGAVCAADTNATGCLSFTNTGATNVMLRPRRDIELLAPGDSFMANGIRASIMMLAISGLLSAFGLLLSAALSRPVALFTAAVLLAAAMMAPDAVGQFPDEFNATVGEKAGLAISRAVMAFTSAFTSVSPVSDLASGRMIAMHEIIRTGLLDLFCYPALLLFLSSFPLRAGATRR